MKDFTQGNINKSFVSFIIPMFFRSLAAQLYAFVDMAVVGHFLGKKALSATSGIFPVLFIIFSLFIAFFVGITSVSAQIFAKKDFKALEKLVYTALTFTTGSGLLFTVVMLAFDTQILSLLNLPEEIFPLSKEYFDILMTGNMFIFGFYGLTNILHGLGNSKVPMFLSFFYSFMNIAGDLIFTLIFKLGIFGIGLSTTLSHLFGFFLALHFVKKELSFLKLRFKICFNREIFKRISKIGLPALGQMLAISVGYFLQQIFINNFGVDFIAATGVGDKLTSIITMIGVTVANALTSTIGQNYKLKLWDRVKKLMLIAGKIVITVAVGYTLLLWIFPGFFVKLFVSDPQVIAMAKKYLHILPLSYVFLGSTFIFTGFFRGIGKTNFSMYSSITASLIIKIGLILILAYKIDFQNVRFIPENPFGIWIAITIANISDTILNAYFFFSRKWER